MEHIYKIVIYLISFQLSNSSFKLDFNSIDYFLILQILLSNESVYQNFV